MFRYNGEPAIGLAVSMVKNGDALALGERLAERMAVITNDLPIGIEPHLVADQPHVVEEFVGEFIKTLIEAVAIVLGVSFLSLGFRPGVVVAIAIPLVLAATFVVMYLSGISLQRISLGALIIALGLLVDDAMIAVEMMIKKLEEGADKVTAATFAYETTAFPMLTGTLVTISGFVPVGFAASSAGEYCFTLFAVVTIALIVSWIVAVLFTPLTGVLILPNEMKGHGHGPSKFAKAFHSLLDRVLRAKYLVVGVTVGLFALSLVGMRFVQQQFFPASDRPELLVNLTLPQSTSLYGTREAVDRLEKVFKADPDIDHWTFYVGSGAIRFYLPLDAQLANDFFAQAVVVTKGFKERPGVQARLEAVLARDFDTILTRVSPLELGPPVGWPLKFRIGGPDATEARALAHSFAQLLGENPDVRNINYDWNEPSKVVRVEVDQDRARALGISSQSLASNINAILSGTVITQVRDDIYLVDVVARAVPEERAKLETLRSLMIATPDGRSVPLSQVATLSYQLEPPLIWSRQRQPTVTVQADLQAGHRGGDGGARVRAKARRVQGQAAARIQRGCRRLRRGQRQGSGQHPRGLSSHADHDDHYSHGAAAKLPEAHSRARNRTAGADRRRGLVAALSCAYGLRGHPRRDLARRHGDTQLGHPDRSDRQADRRGAGPLARRHNRDGAPIPAHHADGVGRHSRYDSDRADGVLGADGVRGDGRPHGGDAAYARFPAGALCGLVRDQAA